MLILVFAATQWESYCRKIKFLNETRQIVKNNIVILPQSIMVRLLIQINF